MIMIDANKANKCSINADLIYVMINLKNTLFNETMVDKQECF